MTKSPKQWMERFDRSKKQQAKVIEEGLEYKKAYCGDLTKRRGKRLIEDKMAVNFIYSYIEIIAPTLFSGQPKIIARPKGPQFEASAKNQQENVNYWAKELGAAEEFKSALFDSFFGFAAVEVGWDYVTEIREEEVPGDVVTLPDGTPGMMPPKKVQKEYIRKDRPFIKWRNPRDIFLDVDVPRKKDGRFQIYRDVVTYDYFMGMNKIPDEIKNLVKPTLRPEDEMDYSDSFGKDKDKDMQSDKEWVELLWIWCKETEKRYLMTPTVKDKFLLEEPWPYFLQFEDDEWPVTILDGKTDYASPYSFSEFRPVWDHIQERNRLRTAFLIHMKRSLPKYIGTKANTRAQMSKLMNARSDEYTELNNPDAVKMAPVTEMPRELYQWDSIIKDDLLNISGLFEFQADSIADTATEASLIEGRAAVRKKRRAQEFERFVTICLAKLGMLCQQFQDQKVAIAITNDQDPNAYNWLNLSKEDIQGEFHYDIEPGIMEYKNEALRKQQVLKFAELMRGSPNVDQRKLDEKLSLVFDIKPEEIIIPASQIQKPPPEPMVTFAPIKLENIPIPAAQSAIVQAAMQQNGVSMPQPQPEPQQAPGGAPLPPMEGTMPQQDETVPMGGKMPLPPNLGQQEVQDASRADTNIV